MAVRTALRRGQLKFEVGASPTPKSVSEDAEANVFRLNWDVEIRISIRTPENADHFSWEGDGSIEDPFSHADHVEVEHYLNESLRSNKFSFEDATRLSDMLDRYRKALFKGLGQSCCIKSKMYDEVEFHVYDYGENFSASVAMIQSVSIHSLQCEHLEEPSLWPTASPHGVMSVTVRRRIGMMPPEHHKQFARHYPSQWKEGRVNILLVVARRGVYEPVAEDFSNPATIQCTLPRMQAELLEKDRPLRIHVEVVRPGSFKELSAHLTLRASQHGPNFFQIVHFDLHGVVTPSGKAVLELNEYGANRKLKSEKCEAYHITKLLAAHKIGCAILGACKSAQADADVHANLSWTLIKSGRASHVLAMSFNMPDSMSEKFFKSFYLHFLLNGREFGEAASIARRHLFTDRDRRHHNLKRDFPIQDWFVPVVYSNGTHLSLGGNLVQATLSWTFLRYVATITYLGIVIQLLRVEMRLSRLLLGTFSCSPPLGLVTLRWIIQNRRHERLSKLSKRLDSEILATNILRVEGDLKEANAIYFYCPDEVRKMATPFLDGLLEVWKRTHFLERYKVVHAEWFLETGRIVSLRHGWRWLFNNACHNVMKPFTETHGSPEPKSLVIVKNMNILYPEKTGLTDDHLDARNRMFAWLDENFGQSIHRTRPYLMVIVGGKRYWDERKVGQTCQVLRSAAPTESATRYS